MSVLIQSPKEEGGIDNHDHEQLCCNTSKELPAHTVLHTKIEILLRLERVIEGDDEGMVGRGQDLLLCKCALDLVAPDHLLL